ncbi:glycoside hydrolase [Metschnikowia bicuspidata var. bicuspidata NRRL YB-4993]|uniref:glucan endo-1,3-beta-D-glucosidase n=1 Tax=Metschnikowia bicuspidata var. bicuspidata NRRL YB-4993 TaxID=869754 RepID=A0A1A0H6P5_9ASCO|nr:glycoside hydrolase [Metschnikowia bicuspidata var. bicuspidata NRRL YB-4993]OBA19583.1 glycoside hydrolase [Metschnikowia bicuspidata var. bicuspidata NRRL YB-4993]
MVKLFGDPLTDKAPPGLYAQVPHEQAPVGCNLSTPIQTNNTFNNMLLGDQTFPIWPLPYLVWVTRDGGVDAGIALNHTQNSQIVCGPDPVQNPTQFYFNPPKIKLFAFTASDWADVDVNIARNSKLATVLHVSGKSRDPRTSRLVVPLVYGMGFVTGIYENEWPVINSAVGIQEFRKVGIVNKHRAAKYYVKLFDQVVWSLYISVNGGAEFTLSDPHHIRADRPVTKCVVQLARGETAIYDTCCQRYPVDVILSGEVDKSLKTGYYALNYQMEGESQSGSGLVFVLPHMQEELAPEIRSKFSGLILDSPTKGVMRGYVSDVIAMNLNNLPFDIGFKPWTGVQGYFYSGANYTDEIKSLITSVAANEASQDVTGMCDLDSMYFAGKMLDKFAQIAYVAHFIVRSSDVTLKILPQIKAAIEKFAANHQKKPLVYDVSWKGLISSGGPDEDFGNSNYNDHHFHYGYHVHAIALVAIIDPRWLDENGGLIRNYAVTLVRDYANFSNRDPFFPQTRNFDWFHGHSFAHGIFPSGDGKNEESSSEDYHSIHALQLLGKVLGNDELEAHACLMLRIMKTSLNMYMLFKDDNQQQPVNFRGNKVSGILFENKVDFATFFGRGTVGDEFIHGIHMIPITPVSSYIRDPIFVREEWQEKLAGIVDRIPDGWQGLLRLNQGLFDPPTAWKWFARSDWNPALIDGGMSRTWSLAYLAGIGAAQ